MIERREVYLLPRCASLLVFSGMKIALIALSAETVWFAVAVVAASVAS
jgi:hypothetical protein